LETVRRKIQAKKFYTTLPHKINSAVEDFKLSTPVPEEELDWKFEEVGEFGQDGWTISYNYKSTKDD
tara:strand:+ start:1016 stop:1216 length:201 start_codon:yes stop_codon:yes gene_type:complete